MSNSHSPAPTARQIRRHLRHVAEIIGSAAELNRIDTPHLHELALRVASIHGHPLINTAQRSDTVAQRLRLYRLHSVASRNEDGQSIEKALDTEDVAALIKPEKRGNPVSSYLRRRTQLEMLRHPYEASARKTAADLSEVEVMLRDGASGDAVLDALHSALNDVQAQVVSATQTRLAEEYMAMLLTYAYRTPQQSTQHAENFMRALEEQQEAAARSSLQLDSVAAIRLAERRAPVLTYLAECSSRKSAIPASKSPKDALQIGVDALTRTSKAMRAKGARIPQSPIPFEELADACENMADAIRPLAFDQGVSPDISQKAVAVLESLQPTLYERRGIIPALRREADRIRSGSPGAPPAGERQRRLRAEILPWIAGIAEAIRTSYDQLERNVSSYEEASIRNA